MEAFMPRRRVHVGVDLDAEEAAFVDAYVQRYGRMGRATVLRRALRELRERENALPIAPADRAAS